MRAWVNYDDVVDQLQAAGIILRGALEVGTHKPVRLHVDGDREKRGWYWLNDIELERDGSRDWYLVGSFGVWRGNDNGVTKVRLPTGKRRVTLSADEKKAIATRHRENAKRAKAIRQAEAERAAAKAAHVWRQYVPTGESEYLIGKQVRAHGLRFSPSGNGTLAIPMTDAAGRVHGLQIIRSRKRQGQLAKEYWPKGLSKQSHYHMIGAPVGGGVVLLAEGYATGASLFEATGLPVAVAFDAGNLVPVAEAIRKAYRGVHVLVCADDDYLTEGNPGVKAAKAAALAVDGAVAVPEFPFDRAGQKLTDWNDLAVAPDGGAHLVRSQIEAAIRAAGWHLPTKGATRESLQDTVDGTRPDAPSIMTLDEAVERFIPINDGTGDTLFDTYARELARTKQMTAVLPSGVRFDDVKRHPDWSSRGSYYLDEVGFDPAGTDPKVKLNLFAGWPVTPVKGSCVNLLELLAYLCSADGNSPDLFDWILKWLAFPLQNPGAKMRTALVVHGGQGGGKSLFFESVAGIYGEYGVVIGQAALEDKFNADWQSKKLFVVADEVVAGADRYHQKNTLKALITGEHVRCNPKNRPAHRERNQMNIVFLSNEKNPVILEADDRRHCVVWTPEKMSKASYRLVTDEIDAGGIPALYHYLLHEVDLDGFHPWVEPPMTAAKADLIELGISSEERFLRAWQGLEIEVGDRVVPFCPCQGSSLYKAYREWCADQGEPRPRAQKDVIGHFGKLPGWSAGKSEATYRDFQTKERKNRKLVIPSAASMVDAARSNGSNLSSQADFLQGDNETKIEWLTRCHLAFEKATNKSPDGWSA